MRIAVIGIRGIPVAYSTFETFIETLGINMVKRKHKITVYCRRHYIKHPKPKYHGINRLYLPSFESKHLSTFTHSLFSTLHACITRNYDVVFYLGVGNTIFTIFPRIFGMKTIVHIDGFDWEREKWGFFARKFLKLSVFLTNFFPNEVISDNIVMIDYYKKTFEKSIINIPYGYFTAKTSGIEKLLKKHNLEKGKYLVWVGRIVPENNLDEFIYAFSKAKPKIKGLIIGDDLFDSIYKRKMTKLILENPQLIRTGFIAHDDVLTLVANSYAYVETKRNGGTQMALIEAMGTGALIISNNSPAHRNVLDDTAIFYSVKNARTNLIKVLNEVFGLTHGEITFIRKQSQKRAKDNYRWTKIIDQYEDLFYKVKGK